MCRGVINLIFALVSAFFLLFESKMQFKLQSVVAIALYICFAQVNFKIRSNFSSFCSQNYIISEHLCVRMFFSQICQSVDDDTIKKYKERYEIKELHTYLNGSDAIKDLGPEFIADVQSILEKFPHNTYVIKHVMSLVSDSSSKAQKLLFLFNFSHNVFISAQMEQLADTFDGKNAKITSATIKRKLTKKQDQDECGTVNAIDILKPIMLKQLPLERISGVFNLLYVLDGDGTEKDLESALVR